MRDHPVRVWIVTFGGAAAFAFAVLSVFDVARGLVIPVAGLTGALAIVVETRVFRLRTAPVQLRVSASVLVAGLVACVSSIGVAYYAGEVQSETSPVFSFVARGGSVDNAQVFGGPAVSYPVVGYYSWGTIISIDCVVDEVDIDWYRVADNRGWVNSQQFIRAPHTAEGTPPRCPD